jgi:hypothetical protein
MTYTLSMMASMKARPSVSGTNRKWYIAVSANCQRDRSTTAWSIMGVSLRKRTRPAPAIGPSPSVDFPIYARVRRRAPEAFRSHEARRRRGRGGVCVLA